MRRWRDEGQANARRTPGPQHSELITHPLIASRKALIHGEPNGPYPEKLPRLRLQKGREKRVRSGHPWIFSNELQEVPPLAPGILVAVDGPGGEPMGMGYYNPHTLIAVRWLRRGGDELPGALGRRAHRAGRGAPQGPLPGRGLRAAHLRRGRRPAGAGGGPLRRRPW